MLFSVKDSILLKRSTSNSNAYEDLINLYKDLGVSKLATHNTSDETTGDPDLITFNFLSPLKEFLEEVLIPRLDKEGQVSKLPKIVIETFDEIFDLMDRKSFTAQQLIDIVGNTRKVAELTNKLLKDDRLKKYDSDIREFFKPDKDTTYSSIQERNDKLSLLADKLSGRTQDSASDVADPASARDSAANGASHQSAGEAETSETSVNDESSDSRTDDSDNNNETRSQD